MMKDVIRFIDKLNERRFVLLLVVVHIFYYFFIGLQGLDLTDEGWLLTGFQQIFTNPDNIHSMFYIYDTLLIGGIWDKCFGMMGIISFRVLATICLSCIPILVYAICKRYVPKWIILLTLCFTMSTRPYLLVFDYNCISALLLLLISLLIMKSLWNNSVFYILCAGLIMGLSFFFRFPNITFGILILSLLPYYIYTREKMMTIRLFLFEILGLLLGLSFNIVIIVVLGHWEYMVDMLHITSSFMSDSDSTHNLSHLLSIYAVQFREIFSLMGLLMLFLFLLFFIKNNNWDRLMKNGLIFFVTVVFLMYTVVWYKSHHFLSYLPFYLSFAFSLLFCLIFLVRQETNDPEKIVLISISILILLIFPLGSDGGIHNMGEHCLYLPLVVSMGLFFDFVKKYFPNHMFFFRQIVVGGLMLSIVCLLIITISTCYRDVGLRMYKTSRSLESSVPTTYTTYANTLVIDNLLVHLKPLLNDTTELIAFPGIPIIHYLTKTPSYLNCPWIRIVSDKVFRNELANAEINKPSPVIVIVKDVDFFHWPRPNKEYKNVLDCYLSPIAYTKTQTLAAFIKRHQYHVYYENDFYQILISTSSF